MPGQSPWTPIPDPPSGGGWTPVDDGPSGDVDPNDWQWAQSAGRSVFGALTDSLDPHLVQTAGHGVIGILKGLGHTAEGLGKAVQSIPGVRGLVDAAYGKPGLSKTAFAAADEALAPKDTAERVGHTAEQAAEFLLPAGAAERGAAAVTAKLAPRFVNAPRLVQAATKIAPRMATEAASAAGVASAQGGNPLSAGVIGAAGPLVSGAIGAAAPALEEAAGKQVEQFLGATKERYKAMAQRIAPDILKRGLRGSRDAVLEQSATAAEEAGQAIDSALQQYGGRSVDTSAVHDALEQAKDAFRTTREMTPIEAMRGGHVAVKDGAMHFPTGGEMDADGMVHVPVVFEPRAVKQLDGLQTVIKQLGPDASVEQMVAIRRAWDNVVSQAGGYQHRAGGAIGLPLKDTTEAWAKREGASAIRKLLDQDVPELTALNKEFSFWKSLNDVLTQTTQRTGPQGPGLTREIAGAAGAAAGSTHGIGAAFALQKIGKIANAAFTSPRWRLASAQMKDKLAKAIASGNTGEAAAVLARITAGGASQAAAPGGQP